MRSTKKKIFHAAILALICVFMLSLPAEQAPQGRQSGQGRPSDQFAGQTRINALVVSGGGFHDYPLQAKVLVDSVSKALPVDWTVAIQEDAARQAGSRWWTNRTGRRASTSWFTTNASPIPPTRR